MRIKEVDGDGNCFFRSVADQFEGHEGNHAYYRNIACEYIEENADFIKFFIEDDKPIEKYLEDMKKSGTWGGNIEIYSLSMKLKVNFYIHLYNRPLYIVKNHDKPVRNLYLSYHDGEHYNSIRLLDDFSTDETPPEIPLELLTGVSQTNDSNALNEDYDDSDNENFDDHKKDKEIKEESSEENDNEEKKEDNGDGDGESINEEQFILEFKGVNILDKSQIKDKKALKPKILTNEGILYNEISLSKKCYCNSNKKYKNCHSGRDLLGDYDITQNILYCSINELYDIFSDEMSSINQVKDSKVSNPNKDNKNNGIKNNKNEENEIKEITKKVELIYI